MCSSRLELHQNFHDSSDIINNMDHVAWANKNKKSIAREFIRRTSFVPSDHPTGIFTAGLPGAGKTEFTLQLLENIVEKPVRIDMDEVAALIEGYRPEIADKFRGGASTILSRIYDEVLKHRLDFVFDGTFAQDRAIENLRRALTHGYTVKVYYLHQQPSVAWEFTKARELIEHRAIDKSGFVETYASLQKNLRNLCDNYPSVTRSLIVKNDKNSEGARKENVQDLFADIPAFLTKEELEGVLL